MWKIALNYPLVIQIVNGGQIPERIIQQGTPQANSARSSPTSG